MTYHYYEDSRGEWRWRLKAANGRIIADSGEGYKNEHDCLDDISFRYSQSFAMSRFVILIDGFNLYHALDYIDRRVPS